MYKLFAIVVTYNGMKWYDKCFGSLKNSSIPIHTIVIDNASTDNTISYIKKNYPDIYLIESNKNLGFGKANNIGIKYALEQGADYVFLLNQDAYIMPDTIEKLHQQMQQNPEYGILSPIHLSGTKKELDYNFSTYISVNRCPDLVSDFIVKKRPEDKIYSVEFVNAALWLISKECLNKIGVFCPLFSHYGEDNNYLQRLTYHNIKFGIYPFAWGVHDRSQNVMKKIDKQCKSRIYVYHLILLCNINNSFIRSLLTFTMATLFQVTAGKFILSNLQSWIRIVCITHTILKHRKIMKGNRAYM